MVLYSRVATLTAQIACFLSCALVYAAPHDDPESLRSMGAVPNGSTKREDQDDTDADIMADGTGPLRDGRY